MTLDTASSARWLRTARLTLWLASSDSTQSITA